jgi:hypothetical protein
MNRYMTWRGVIAAIGLVGATACTGDLNVENTNSPDVERAFSDPAAIAGLAGGALRTWFLARQDFNTSLVQVSQADSYSASWNNFNLRYFSSYDKECTDRCGYVNDISSSFYCSGADCALDPYWYGFYSAISSANDVLNAIQHNGVEMGSPAETKMVETVATLVQGMSLAGIALNYDQGFVVTQDTDISDPLAIPVSTRQEVRDAALAVLEDAHTMALGTTFTTPSSYVGTTSGRTYTNTQIAQLARTAQAELVAFFPRNKAEDDANNWAAVANYAKDGISYDFEIYQDFDQWYDGQKIWGNLLGTMVLDTRLAHVITAGPDPAKVHVTPWPVPNGNPQPDAYDARVGDGTWGPDGDPTGAGVIGQSGNGGSDFAYNGLNFFRPARGFEHYSNLTHVRYAYLTYIGYGLPGDDGTGQDPLYSKATNDLLWAEGLIRGGGSKTQAAQLINNTRVGRGKLAPLTGAEDNTTMLKAAWYEQEIEILGMGAGPYYNRRRQTPSGWTKTQPCPGTFCLWEGTPRQMPMPARELLVLKKELYSFGGPDLPDMSAGATDGSKAQSRVPGVRQKWAEFEKKNRPGMRPRSRQ